MRRKRMIPDICIGGENRHLSGIFVCTVNALEMEEERVSFLYFGRADCGK